MSDAARRADGLRARARANSREEASRGRRLESRARLAAAATALALVLGAGARADEPKEAGAADRPPALAPASVEASPTVFAALAQPAKTPREALLKLELAARTGEPERAIPLFAEPFGSALKKTCAAGHLLVDASRRLERAVATRLGPDAARALALEKRAHGTGGLTPEEALEVVSVRETKDGATAVVRARGRATRSKDELVELVKQAGEWKILPPKRDGHAFAEEDLAQMDALAKGLENAAAAIVKLASEVESGLVTSVVVCRQQLEAADLEVMKAMAGFGSGDDDR
jgi:hypothetical protein